MLYLTIQKTVQFYVKLLENLNNKLNYEIFTEFFYFTANKR